MKAQWKPPIPTTPFHAAREPEEKSGLHRVSPHQYFGTVPGKLFPMGSNVIELRKRDGKIYVEIHDFQKLRELFGELLRENQRVKSEGDYEAGKSLIDKPTE